MAGANVEDAGAEATCPRCGSVVKLHAMVPVLAGGAATPERICVRCARAQVTVPARGYGGNGETTLDHVPPPDPHPAPAAATGDPPRN